MKKLNFLLALLFVAHFSWSVDKNHDDKKSFNDEVSFFFNKDGLSLFKDVVCNREKDVEPYLKVKVLLGFGREYNEEMIKEFFSLCQYVKDLDLSFQHDLAVLLIIDARAFSFDGLKSLNLSHTSLQGATYFLPSCESLKNLTSLNLDSTYMNDKDLARLTKSVYLVNLESLSLMSNHIGIKSYPDNEPSDKGILALIASPNFSKLNYLNLRRNKINEEKKELLKERFPFVILDYKIEIPINFNESPHILETELFDKKFRLEFEKKMLKKYWSLIIWEYNCCGKYKMKLKPNNQVTYNFINFEVKDDKLIINESIF